MTLVDCLWSLCPLFSLFIHAFFFLLRNNKLNLRRLGGSKGWSLVFTKSSSVEIRTGNTIKFNCFSVSLSLNSDSTITFLTGYTKAYCIIKKLIFLVAIHCKQFILVSEKLVGLGIPLCRIKTCRKPWWVFWLPLLPVWAFLTGSLQTGALTNETKAAEEWYLLAN